MRVALVCSMIVALASAPARAESVEFSLNTGNGLLSACTFASDEQTEVEYHFGTCIGYIKGVTNAFAVLQLAQGSKVPYCARENMDNGQLRDIVVKALRENPEQRDQTPVPAILGAMKRAFPCPA
jgi:Rap1a immunity proteins